MIWICIYLLGFLLGFCIFIKMVLEETKYITVIDVVSAIAISLMSWISFIVFFIIRYKDKVIYKVKE